MKLNDADIRTIKRYGYRKAYLYQSTLKCEKDENAVELHNFLYNRATGGSCSDNHEVYVLNDRIAIHFCDWTVYIGSVDDVRLND